MTGDIQIAAQNAAKRWKESTDKSQELRGQIMDTFKVCKLNPSVTGHYQPIRQAWKDAFEAVGHGKDFDFEDQSRLTPI
jgi:hypothetical protein